MPVRSILRRAKSIFEKDPNAVLRNVKGVIHVGANTGQEIGLYDRYGLSVVWIEPNPDVFNTLQSNLNGFPRQIAIKGLVTDLENVEYQFHLANNNGESSSILELNLHQDIWPEIRYEKTISLLSSTLPSLLKDNDIDTGNYDMLVMDTQGSELLVLKGAIPILKGFTYIKAEVPDFESYKGCCQLKDLQLFLDQQGFREYSRHPFAKRRGGGSYFDIIYKKR
jgi:FkbM family methyltransferase